MHDYPHYKYRPRRRKKEKTCDTKSKILQAKPKTLTHVETPEPSPCTSQDPETYHPIEYITHYPTTTHFLPTPDVSPNEASHDTNYQGTRQYVL